MSSNMPAVTTLQRQVSNLFKIVSEFLQKSGVTSKALTTIQKYLYRNKHIVQKHIYVFIHIYHKYPNLSFEKFETL